MANVAVLAAADDVHERLRRNLKMLVAVKYANAAELYMALGLTRTTWSQRLSGAKPTKFSLDQALALAAILGLTIDELVMPTEELTRLVAERQNWKKMMAPDLRLHRFDRAKPNGQRAMLVPVPSAP